MRSLLSAVGALLAFSVANAQFGPTPTVTISNGVIVGTTNVQQGQDRFLAIPYAQPPVGENRLRAPRSFTTNYGTFMATASPSACPNFAIQIVKAQSITKLGAQATGGPNLFNVLTPQPSDAANPEDCLRLNVQRPSGIGPSAKLPVLFWIWGGSFQVGNVAPTYDANIMLNKAMQMKKPFVFVSLNYRLAALGFLPGKQLSAEEATNLGLRDQRAALEWVADNIAAFGGDPDKVTIMGNSGGAWCIMDHLLVNRGDHTYKGKPLFRGAIMNSGATFPTYDVLHPKQQASFDNLTLTVGCDPNAADVTDCLRKVELNKYMDATNLQADPDGIVVLSYVARPDPGSNFFPTSPEEALLKGEYAKVPIITGNMQDEGTFFAIFLGDYDGNNDKSVKTLLRKMYPEAPDSTFQSLLNNYPKDITAGCPYNTGIFNEIYSGYKRLSSFLGDIPFILPRRAHLDAVTGTVKTWSFISTYNAGTPVLGTCHAADTLAFWVGGVSPVALDQIFTRFINFYWSLDPNAGLPANYTPWPQYDLKSRTLISFDTLGVSFMKDTFRSSAYKAFKAVQTQLKA